MQDTTITELAKRLRETAAELEQAVGDAMEDQYHQPPIPKTRDDVRPSGGISRPTEDVALDARRQGLRGAVVASGPVLQAALILTRGALRSIQIAHEKWRGLE